MGGELLRGVVDELEMHAPFQKCGGCDVFRDGRDVVLVLDGGVTVAAGVRVTMSGWEGEGKCARVEGAEWCGLGVVGGGGGGERGGREVEGLSDGSV